MFQVLKTRNCWYISLVIAILGLELSLYLVQLTCIYKKQLVSSRSEVPYCPRFLTVNMKLYSNLDQSVSIQI